MFDFACVAIDTGAVGYVPLCGREPDSLLGDRVVVRFWDVEGCFRIKSGIVIEVLGVFYG